MITLIVTLAVIGLVVWLITTYIPMPDLFKRVIYIIAVICVVFYLLQVFGLLGHIHDIDVPKIN